MITIYDPSFTDPQGRLSKICTSFAQPDIIIYNHCYTKKII